MTTSKPRGGSWKITKTIDRSSFGSPAAKQIRAKTPAKVASRIVRESTSRPKK